MKKLTLLITSASFLAASAVYANTTVIINNQLTSNTSTETIWVNGYYDLQTKSSQGSSSFNNLPKGNSVISSQWPTDILSGAIVYITGDYVDSAGNNHNLVASPSCKNIKITPNATNQITVTSGMISIPIKMDAAVCAVAISK